MNAPSIFCKCFQVFRCNSHNLISVIRLHIYLIYFIYLFFFFLIDRTLSGVTTLGSSGPGSNGSERVLWSLAIRGFCVISGHSLGRYYSSAEMQSVYSTTPADWASCSWRLFQRFHLKWVSPSPSCFFHFPDNNQVFIFSLSFSFSRRSLLLLLLLFTHKIFSHHGLSLEFE